MSNAPMPLFATLGETIRYLRRRARLTQRELSIAVGYSESLISRLEKNERQVDTATLLAVFVPALEIADQPEMVQRILALAAAARMTRKENSTAADIAARGLPTVPRSDTALLTNLPSRQTSFIGRADSIAALRQLVPTTRLVTLTGVGGVGKTSLAQTVVSGLASSFVDGIWWVALAPLAAANLVSQTITAVFRLPEPHDRTYLEALTTYCQSRHLLLVLDNCEHVIDACAEIVDWLICSCPQLHILTTSREVLRVAGEVEWPVAPLATPQLNSELSALTAMHTLHEDEAVCLFIERAQAIQPAFAWTDKSAKPIATICAQLDGIPLAIELAASRIKSMTISELATRLNDRFALLSGGPRTALPRHQTLRATMDWSYELLSEPERAMLRRLSVFTDGWTMDAAEAIASAQANQTQPISHSIEVLLQLVNKSLVVVEMRESQTRYHLLETIRQYAAEKLQEFDEVQVIRAQHFTYYLGVVEQSTSLMFVRRRIAVQMAAVEEDVGNVRSALVWSREQKDSGERCLRLAGALWWFWSLHGRFHEGQIWLEEALSQGVAAPLKVRATAMVGLAHLVTFTVTPLRRAALAEEALALCQAVDDGGGTAVCYAVLGQVAAEQGDFPHALECYKQAVELFRTANWWLFTVLCVSDMADTLMQMGQVDQALPLYEECLATAWNSNGNLLLEPGIAYSVMACLFKIDAQRGRTLFEQEMVQQRTLHNWATLATLLSVYGNELIFTGKPQDLDEGIEALTECLGLWKGLGIIWARDGGIARASLYLALAHNTKGEYKLAMDYGKEASRLYQEVGDVHGVAWAQLSIGRSALPQGDLLLAEISFRASLELSPDGSMSNVPHALIGLAETVGQQGNLARAGRLFGAAVRFDNHKPISSEPIKNLSTMQAVRTYLDDPVFAAAWSEGKARPLAEVIAYALE